MGEAASACRISAGSIPGGHDPLFRALAKRRDLVGNARRNQVRWNTMADENSSGKGEPRLSTGGWLAIVVLAGLLVWSLWWYAAHAWSALGDTQISTAGWIFLA